MARIETYKRRHKYPATTGMKPLSNSDMDALNAEYKAMRDFGDTATNDFLGLAEAIYKGKAKKKKKKNPDENPNNNPDNNSTKTTDSKGDNKQPDKGSQGDNKKPDKGAEQDNKKPDEGTEQDNKKPDKNQDAETTTAMGPANIIMADLKQQNVTGITEIDNYILNEFNSYDTNPDETTYRKSLEQTINKLSEVVSSKPNSESRRFLEQHIESMKPYWENSLQKAILNRKVLNTQATIDNTLNTVKNYDLTNPGERLEAEGLVGASADLMHELGYPKESIVNWTIDALKDVDNQEIFQNAQKISVENGYEQAIKFIQEQGIEEDAKLNIVNDIKFEAAQRKLQQDTNIQQTEQQFEAKYDQQQLTTAEVTASNLPEDRKLTWNKLIGAQADERLNGQVDTDWEVYDKLKDIVGKYELGEIVKDKVLKELSKAVGKKIPTSIEKQFRVRLATIDNPDDPMNRDDVKRGIDVLDGLEKMELRGAEDFADKRRIRLENLKRKNEYEAWIRGQEKLSSKDIEEKIASMSKAKVEEVTLNWLEKMFTPKEDTPFFGKLALYTEEDQLVDKKIQRLMKLGYWKDFTDDEKETVTQAFRIGRTVQDVVDLIE